MPLKDLRELMKYNEVIPYNHCQPPKRCIDFPLMCGVPVSKP